MRLSPISPILSPNAKAVISLSLLAVAQPASITFLALSGITAKPHIANHKFWELKAALLDWLRGLRSVAPRIHFTYLNLSHAISTHNTLKSFTQADLLIFSLAAATLSLWIIPLSLLRTKDTRDVMRSSVIRQMVFAYLTLSVISIVSTTIWGYTPSPMFGLFGLLSKKPQIKPDDGGGSKKSDEESPKEPVDVDVGQGKA
jgi:hypothetical protein